MTFSSATRGETGTTCEAFTRALRLGGTVDDELAAVIAELPNKFFAVDPRGTRSTHFTLR